MIKKIYFIIYFMFYDFSCGKKGDPVYKDQKKKFKKKKLIKSSLMKYIKKNLLLKNLNVEKFAKKYGTPIIVIHIKN